MCLFLLFVVACLSVVGFGCVGFLCVSWGFLFGFFVIGWFVVGAFVLFSSQNRVMVLLAFVHCPPLVPC